MVTRKVKNSLKAKRIYKKTLSKKRRNETKKVQKDINKLRKAQNEFVSSYDFK